MTSLVGKGNTFSTISKRPRVERAVVFGASSGEKRAHGRAAYVEARFQSRGARRDSGVGRGAVLAQVVLADPRDFTMENDSLSSIYHLYVSPSSSTGWGDDILGVDVLPAGQSVDITFDTSLDKTCIYDILVVSADGSRTRKNRENLCTTSTEYYSED